MTAYNIIFSIAFPIFILYSSSSTFIFGTDKGNCSYQIPYGKLKSVSRSVDEDFVFVSPITIGLSDGVGGYNFPSSHMAGLLVLNTSEAAVKSVYKNEKSFSDNIEETISKSFLKSLYKYDHEVQSAIRSLIKNYKEVYGRRNTILNMDDSQLASMNSENGDSVHYDDTDMDKLMQETKKQADEKSNFDKLSSMDISSRAFVFSGAGTLLQCYLIDTNTSNPKLRLMKTGDSLMMHFKQFKYEDGKKHIFLPAYITNDMQNAFNAPAQITSYELYSIKASIQNADTPSRSSKLLQHLLQIKLNSMIEEFEAPVSSNDILLLASDGLYDNFSATIITIFVNYILFQLEQFNEGKIAEPNPSTILRPLINEIYKKTEAEVDETINHIVYLQHKRMSAERIELRKWENYSEINLILMEDANLYQEAINMFTTQNKHKIDKELDLHDILTYLSNKNYKKKIIPIEKLTKDIQDEILRAEADQDVEDNILQENLQDYRKMDAATKFVFANKIIESRKANFSTFRDEDSQNDRIAELKKILLVNTNEKSKIQIDTQPLHKSLNMIYNHIFENLSKKIQHKDLKLVSDKPPKNLYPVQKPGTAERHRKKQMADVENFLEYLKNDDTNTTSMKYKSINKRKKNISDESKKQASLFYEDSQHESDNAGAVHQRISSSAFTVSHPKNPIEYLVKNAASDQSDQRVIKKIYKKNRFTIVEYSGTTSHYDSHHNTQSEASLQDYDEGSKKNNIKLSHDEEPYLTYASSDNNISKKHMKIESDISKKERKHRFNNLGSLNGSEMDHSSASERKDHNHGFNQRILEEDSINFNCSLTEILDSTTESEVEGIDKVKYSPCVLKFIKKYAVKTNYLPKHKYDFMSKALAEAVIYMANQKPFAFTSFGVKALIFGQIEKGAKLDDISIITTMIEDVDTSILSQKKEILKDIKDNKIKIFELLKRDIEEFLRNIIL